MNRLQAYGIPALFCVGFFIVILAFGFVFDGNLILENAVEDALLVAACWAYRRHRRIAARSGAYTVKNIAVVFVLMILIFYAFQFIVPVVLSYVNDRTEEYLDALYSMDPLALLALSCLLGPLAEEYLYRGIIYANLRERVNVFVAATVSSLTFGLAHGTVAHIPLCLLIGFLSCAVYERTRRVRGCFALHATYNLFTLMMPDIPIGEVFYTAPVAIPIYLAVFAAIVFVLAKAKGSYGANIENASR